MWNYCHLVEKTGTAVVKVGKDHEIRFVHLELFCFYLL